MPLAFESLSHGTVAFGFFNIESDMLLLEKTFFFADAFCSAISAMAQHESPEMAPGPLPGYQLDTPGDVGDLMGAIHGIRYTGFIGDLYRLFPFPQSPHAFRQNPKGYETQQQVMALIETRTDKTTIAIVPADGLKVRIGEILFDRDAFQQLILYVWEGGYPKWKDGRRPRYVHEMKTALSTTQNPLFEGIRLAP